VAGYTLCVIPDQSINQYSFRGRGMEKFGGRGRKWTGEGGKDGEGGAPPNKVVKRVTVTSYGMTERKPTIHQILYIA